MNKMAAYCTICLHIFDAENPMSVTPCCHVFHSSCLAKWMDESETCPECCSPEIIKDIQRLFLNFRPGNDSEYDNEVSNLKVQVSAKDAELSKSLKLIDELVIYCEEADKDARKLQQIMANKDSEIIQLRSELISSLEKKGKYLETKEMYDRRADKVQQEMCKRLSHVDHMLQQVDTATKQVQIRLANLKNGLPDLQRKMLKHNSLLTK